MDIAELQRRVSYDPVTGQLTWLDGKNTGKPAFNTPHGEGYMCGKFNGKNLLAHVVAWAIHTGSWPVNRIDHWDGVRNNNRFHNLRDVTMAINGQNRAAQKKNSSLPTGVVIDNSCPNKPYRARVKLGRKFIHVGNYVTANEASNAYFAKVSQLGFSPRHGT